MRKRHWLAGLLSGLLTIVGGQALAQSPPIGQGNMGNPDMSGMPAPYSMNYGTYPSPAGPQANYPPGAAAWPNVSPYGGPLSDQTANENGMWFRNILQGNRKYYFSTEALYGWTNVPNGTVGAPNVNVVNLPATIVPVGALALNTSQFQQTPANTSTTGTPDRELSGSGTGGTSGGSNGGTGTTTVGPPVFGTQITGYIPHDLRSGGMRGTWGWWNPDSSGFQASAFMLSQTSATLDIADPNGFSPTFYSQLANATGAGNLGLQQYLLNELHAYAGIPLAGADSDHNGLPGVVQPFDMYYILKYQTQIAGANADWFSTAIMERPALKVRPMYGARYLTILEKFNFAGADSGLGYQINSPSNTANGSSTTTTTTTSVAGNLSPVAGTLETGVPATGFISPMYSALNSTVNSQLAGPEMGFRVDLGKDKFNIWTQSKFGLLVNYSTHQLTGYNIGDAYYPVSTTATAATIGTAGNTVMPRANGTTIPNNTFNSSNTSTTLSPMFEQGIFAKANLFQFVPVLNKSWVFNQAEIQLGYTALFVGGMSRPATDIDWNAYPVNPQLNSTHQTFFSENYSLGVEWNY